MRAESGWVRAVAVRRIQDKTRWTKALGEAVTVVYGDCKEEIGQNRHNGTVGHKNTGPWLTQRMDRKFKPPFFSGGDIAPNGRACQAHKSWVKIAVLLRLVPAAQLLGSARLARRRAARSNSERAAAMACVGNRFRLSGRLEKIEPLRRGARRGAGRQAEMGEDFDNHRRIFDSGDDLQGTAAVRALFDVDVERNQNQRR